MQVSSFATNAISNPSSADAQRNMVQMAYAKNAGLDQQFKLQEQSRTERKAVDKVKEAERTDKKDEGKKASKVPAQEDINRALQQVNGALSQTSQALTASMERDQDTGIDVFKITDKLTKEVILQLPPKAIVEMAKAMDQAASDKVQLISEKA